MGCLAIFSEERSFRRGGATFTYQVTKDPLLVKAMGDWLSDTFMRYCEIQMEERHKAAKALAAATAAELASLALKPPALTGAPAHAPSPPIILSSQQRRQ